MDAVISKDKKQCPFCGNVYEEELMIDDDKYWTLGRGGRTYFVLCSCGASGPRSDTIVEAIERWNRRK